MITCQLKRIAKCITSLFFLSTIFEVSAEVPILLIPRCYDGYMVPVATCVNIMRPYLMICRAS